MSKLGRPRGFDKTTAIACAMREFWAFGYESTSVDRLSRSMNMPRASLYQLFGDKQGLFIATLDHYSETRMSGVMAALDGNGQVQDRVAAFFEAVITLPTEDPDTPGCLVSCVLADAAGTNPVFRKELSQRFSFLEQKLADCLKDKSRFADPGVALRTASLLAAIARGLMLRARSGSLAETLSEIAETALDLLFPPMSSSSETLN